VDKQSIQELTTLIRAVVREELAKYNHECRFSVSDEDAKEFGHFIGMMIDVGDGRMGKGIEVIRENHKWLAAQRDRGNTLSTAIFVMLVTTLAGGLLTALWYGLKALIGAKGGG
jgi:hypothetical protein